MEGGTGTFVPDKVLFIRVMMTNMVVGDMCKLL